jgi:hypothetical protein
MMRAERNSMKLNFWQWIGIALLILAAVLILRRGGEEERPPAQPAQPPATQPAQ